MSQSKNKKAKPFVKWAGGKRQLLNQYQDFFPKDYNKYYEPMVGGGAVFFNLQPSEAIIADINKDLIIAYQAIKNSVDDVIEMLKGFSEIHSKDFYYKKGRPGFNHIKKSVLNKSVDSISLSLKTELAAYLIYLNRTCFNGLYRVNGDGGFNVPAGRYKNPKICNEENLRKVSEVLNGVEIVHGDFKEIVEKPKEGDLVYFDPPYDPINKTSNFTDYTKGGFTDEDQKELSSTFSDLADRGVKVMLSNSSTDFIKELYSKHNIHELKANRSINSKGSKRGHVKEVLITNF